MEERIEEKEEEKEKKKSVSGRARMPCSIQAFPVK